MRRTRLAGEQRVENGSELVAKLIGDCRIRISLDQEQGCVLDIVVQPEFEDIVEIIWRLL